MGESSRSDQLERSLIDVAVESWRFSKLFTRLVGKLDAGEAGRYVNQLRYFQRKLEESLETTGLRLVNVEGQSFDPGIAASALNLGDFEPDDVLFVDQMVEPIIMGPDGLKKQGTVMLRKAADSLPGEYAGRSPEGTEAAPARPSPRPAR